MVEIPMSRPSRSISSSFRTWAGLLISRGISLQQLVSLFLESSNLLSLQLRPRRQVLEHPVGLLRILTRLGLPLLGGSKLCGHVYSQPGLLREAIPLRFLLVEESGFILATSNKNLKRKKTGIRNAKTQKHAEKEEKSSEYLGSRNDNFTQGSSGLVQGLQHGRNSDVKTLPLHALRMIIEREQS